MASVRDIKVKYWLKSAMLKPKAEPLASPT